jgi:hypothetical protein
MAWPEKTHKEKCLLCGGTFEPFKNDGFVVDLTFEGDDRFIRVCEECDSIYDVLCDLKW